MHEIVATNMSTQQRRVYFCESPVDAVIAAFAQSRDDWNTGDYLVKYSTLVQVGQWFLFCGDWAVRVA